MLYRHYDIVILLHVYKISLHNSVTNMAVGLSAKFDAKRRIN